MLGIFLRGRVSKLLNRLAERARVKADAGIFVLLLRISHVVRLYYDRNDPRRGRAYDSSRGLTGGLLGHHAQAVT